MSDQNLAKQLAKQEIDPTVKAAKDEPIKQATKRDKAPTFKFMTDGRVFWNGAEVVGDENFKDAILKMVAFIAASYCSKQCTGR